MSTREDYSPGPADMAKVEKGGDNWTLALVKELSHPPEMVWEAITDPAQLREWSPFDADRNLGVAGAIVKFSTVGTPEPHIAESVIIRAEAPRILEYKWNDFDTRWELEPLGEGTRLKLWTNIDKRFISMGAAGWHICLDVLERLLGGEPIGRLAGPDAMKFEGWQRLNKEYAQQFGVEAPQW